MADDTLDGRLAVSPPTQMEVDAALAALGRGALPSRDKDPALRRVALIARATGSGATWAQVGEAMGGVSPQVAKRYAKRLAKHLNGDLAAGGIWDG